MPYAEVFAVPVEQRLEPVTIVSLDGMDGEGEFFSDFVYKIYGIGLCVFIIDIQRSCPGSIVYSCVLEAFPLDR